MKMQTTKGCKGGVSLGYAASNGGHLGAAAWVSTLQNAARSDDGGCVRSIDRHGGPPFLCTRSLDDSDWQRGRAIY